MEIKFDAGKRLYTNAIRHRFVQGENLAESITITGPKQVGALDLSQLRMAVRVNSLTYETTVEKTLSQTVQGETISLEWVVDKMFTAVPGPVSVTLVGYGNEEEVIKITSDGILVKADDVNGTAPPESTWEQLLAEMQQFATQTYQNAQAAAASEANAKASETAAAASAQEAQASKTAAAASAQEAKNAAATAAQEAAEQAAAQAAAQTEAQIRSYADDRYARALKATDGPAEQLTIYPDEGSSLQITVHGATVQEGEGDPSPSNVRALSGVGQFGTRIQVPTGWNLNNGVFYRGGVIPSGVDKSFSIVCSIGISLIGIADTNDFAGKAEKYRYAVGFDLTSTSPNYGRMYIKAPFSSVSDLNQWLTDSPQWISYHAGTKPAQMYTYSAVSSDTYSAVELSLNGPLYDGDRVCNDVFSGCDRTIVFDGADDEKWGYSTTDETEKARYTYALPDAVNAERGSADNAYMSSFLLVTNGRTFYREKGFTINNGTLYVYDEGEPVADWKEKLSQNPIILYYRSSNYTEHNDTQVQLETHSKADFIFDGADDKTLSINTSWTEKGDMFVVYYKPPFQLAGSTMNTQCDRLAKATGLGTADATEGWYVHTSSIYLSIAKSRLVEQTVDGLKAWLKQNPVHLVTPWATPIVYAHPAQPLIATPDAEGKITVTGEGQVSAAYNKSITRAIAELQAAALALGANLSI